MRHITEFAGDLEQERRRLDSEWGSLAEVWHDERAQDFYDTVIQPYQEQLGALESAIRALGEHLTETGEIQ